MKMTNHAIIRSQQRGIDEDQIILISIFGKEIYRDRHVVKIILNDKIISRIRYALDRCKNKVIVSDLVYNNIITTYSLNK